MVDQIQLAFRDFDRDRQQTSFDIVDTADSTQAQTMIDALQSLSIGSDDGAWRRVEIEAPTGVAAASPIAQSSTQLIIEMKDTVSGKIFRERLPYPDLTLADDGDGDPAWIATGQGSNSLTVLNSAHGAYVNLVAGVEPIYRTPDGNTATVVRAYIEE